MNVLFLSLVGINSLKEKTIYPELLREFVKHNHMIYILSPTDKTKDNYKIIEEFNCIIYKVYTGSIQKTSTIKKGINTILVESRLKKAVKTLFKDVKFDLVLYPTPPITIVSPIKHIKTGDNARTYLMLKDIFPQNSVDVGMLKTTGLKGVLYQYFRHKEKMLYQVSDVIGCMSQANVDYVIEHNPYVNADKVEVCPNACEIVDMSIPYDKREAIRKKYGLPIDKTIFVYGGNLGILQGIPFLIDCIKSQKNNDRVYFLIIGDGTEYHLLEEFYKNEKQMNFMLLKGLPKDEYDQMVGSCDVGMIFLDHRCTIPNFPSRLLSYMQAKMPVLAVTDTATDIGKVIVDNGFGWWCESNDLSGFMDCIDAINSNELEPYGENAYKHLVDNYNVNDVYNKIVNGL